jgi:DNA-binding transcriptional LysR family regulator
MELRHLDVLLAIAETGSFTSAADELHTVQSNVSEQVRQLERELGVPLLVRSRRGAAPTEFGEVVLERARRIRQEIEAMRGDLSMLLGLEAGHASLGVVGTASRWLIPALVAELRERAPGVRMRITEAPSDRLVSDVIGSVLTLAVVTEPPPDRRLHIEHLLDEALVGLVPRGLRLSGDPVALSELGRQRVILPPSSNPLRLEIQGAAAALGVSLDVPIEIEGTRLIADLVAAGQGVSILPETAVPRGAAGIRTVGLEGLPPRRLALVSARDAHLSLADRAIRNAVVRLVRARLGG